MAFSDLPSDHYMSSDFESVQEPNTDVPSFQNILDGYKHSDPEFTSSTSIDISSDEGYGRNIFKKFTFEENEKYGDSSEPTAPKLNLRDYQQELAENALKGLNTVICAPTGSGKTMVATYIIQEHLKQPGTKKTVAFLARAVSLADQQYKYLFKYLPSYRIGLITGDSQNCMSLHGMIPHYDIIVMTPMILENHIKCKLVPHLGVFSLLVFDECHHTRKGEPYNTLMHSYHKTKHENSHAGGASLGIRLPQIVGLTASIGIEGAEILSVAMDNILRVCANLDARNMSTINNNIDELERYVAVPTEESVLLSERKDNESASKIIDIMQILEMHMTKYIEDLQYGKLQEAVSKRPPNRKSQEYEQWVHNTMNTTKEIPIDFTKGNVSKQKNIRLVLITAMYLKEYRFALETYDLVELKDVMQYLEKSFEHLKVHEERITEENTFYGYFLGLKNYVLRGHSDENPNLHILEKVLMKYLLPKSRCIVFVRTRALAVALSLWLKTCNNQNLRDLNAHWFTGANVPEQKGGTTPGKAESILRLFREGKIRLIVSTSVAEEGLDIPSCNLVIKYNHVGNEVTTVQSRGRTRAFGGKSILLAMKEVLERELSNQRRAELMKSAIEGIKEMPQPQFEEAIEGFLVEIVQAILLEDKEEQERKKKITPFEIRCSFCRQILVKNTHVRAIFGKYRISIDRNLLKKTKNCPTPERTMDEIFFVGLIKCLGESLPGKKCLQLLGNMIKYKGVHFITLGITNIGFNTDDSQELRRFKQWKKVPFHVDELSYDDTVRYLYETESMRKKPDTAADDCEDDSEDDSDDDSDDDSENEENIEDRIKSVQENLYSSHETKVKKLY